MGQPVKIVDLARQMIELSGLQVGDDIEIVFTGLKPGEKLFEELQHRTEQHVATEHPKIMRFVSQQTESEERTREPGRTRGAALPPPAQRDQMLSPAPGAGIRALQD